MNEIEVIKKDSPILNHSGSKIENETEILTSVLEHVRLANISILDQNIFNTSPYQNSFDIHSLLWNILLTYELTKLLTITEQKMLCFFILNPYRVHNEETIKKDVWKWKYITNQAVSTNVDRVRSKSLSFKNEFKAIKGRWYYMLLWEDILEVVEDKIELLDDVWYIPQLQSLYVDWELNYVTINESKILDLFISFPYEVHSRNDILDVLWDNGTIIDRSIDNYIKNIQKKSSRSERVFKVVKGRGYYLESRDFHLEDIKDTIEISKDVYFCLELSRVYLGRNNQKLTYNESIVLNILLSHKGFTIGKERFKLKDNSRLTVCIKWLCKKLNSLQDWLWDNIKTHRWEWYSWK